MKKLLMKTLALLAVATAAAAPMTTAGSPSRLSSPEGAVRIHRSLNEEEEEAAGNFFGNPWFIPALLGKLLCTVLGSTYRCVCTEDQLRQAITDATVRDATAINLCLGTELTLTTEIDTDKTFSVTCDQGWLLGLIPLSGKCTLSGGGTTRILNGDSCIVAFENIRFVDGRVSAGDRSGGGGAARFVDSSRVTLTSCDFENNEAVNGGALLIDVVSSVSVNDCNFKNNNADANGGAMFLSQDSEVEVSDATFSGNTATTGKDIYINDDRAPATDGCYVDCGDGNVFFCDGPTNAVVEAGSGLNKNTDCNDAGVGVFSC